MAPKFGSGKTPVASSGSAAPRQSSAARPSIIANSTGPAHSFAPPCASAPKATPAEHRKVRGSIGAQKINRNDKSPAKVSKTPAGRGAAAATALSVEDRQLRCAAIKIQARWRGALARCRAAALFMQCRRLQQEREDELENIRLEHEAKLRKEAADAAARAKVAKDKQKAEEKREAKREARLQAFRDRRCAIELMCQGLQSHTMPWEEDAALLNELLGEDAKFAMEKWIGKHKTRKAARRQYLVLARKWHPDKWSMQGEVCTSVATDVTKCLVAAYEKAMKELPVDPLSFAGEDDDEEREVWEFASWCGIAFEGMHEIWKERKGIKR